MVVQSGRNRQVSSNPSTVVVLATGIRLTAPLRLIILILPTAFIFTVAPPRLITVNSPVFKSSLNVVLSFRIILKPTPPAPPLKLSSIGSYATLSTVIALLLFGDISYPLFRLLLVMQDRPFRCTQLHTK